MSATKEATLWICESCGFIYDPAIGDPDGGIPPGTAFEDIPKDWFCPVCGARTTDFRLSSLERPRPRVLSRRPPRRTRQARPRMGTPATVPPAE